MVVDASLSTLGVDELDSATELAFTNGITPTMLFLSGGAKRDLGSAIGTDLGSAGTFGGSREIGMAERRAIRAIDVYEPELGGALRIIADRSIPVAAAGENHGWAWLIDPEHIGAAILRPLKYTPLAKTGDSDTGMLIVEATLELLHDKGAAAVKKIVT
jgi:hypothetical protein